MNQRTWRVTKLTHARRVVLSALIHQKTRLFSPGTTSIWVSAAQFAVAPLTIDYEHGLNRFCRTLRELFVNGTNPSRGQSPQSMMPHSTGTCGHDACVESMLPHSTGTCEHDACVEFWLNQSEHHLFLANRLSRPGVVEPGELEARLTPLLDPLVALQVTDDELQTWPEKTRFHFVIASTPQAKSSGHEFLVTLKSPEGVVFSIEPKYVGDSLGDNWHIVSCLRSLETNMAQLITGLRARSIGDESLYSSLEAVAREMESGKGREDTDPPHTLASKKTHESR